MQVNILHPKLDQILTLNPGESTEFHTIELVDRSGGSISLFVEGDWSDWDALVEAVGLHRAKQSASMNRKEMLEVVP